MSDAAESRFDRGYVGTVGASMEFRRILALPRRAPDWDGIEDVTPLFRRPGGTMSFRPIQSAAIVEACWSNGLFAPIGVGHGKELICLGLPTALDSKKTVLLIPPELRGQVARDMERYGRHFNLSVDRITVVAYSELSLAKNTDLLERLEPDLIVANEAHHLARRQSARTKRFLRYMRAHPECRFCALSGTMSSRSIDDFPHLIELALRKGSPLPGNWREVQDWAGAVDVKPVTPMRPGALLKLCAPGESVRDAVGRRIAETPGVVSTRTTEIGVSLFVEKLAPLVPDSVFEKMEQVRRDWRVDDEELADALEYTKVLRELSHGFYYRWVWPDGEPDWEWLTARAAWNRAVREKLRYAREGMDSPHLLYQAAERWHRGERSGLVWEAPEWTDWAEVRNRPEPPKEAVWIDDFACQHAVDRAREYLKRGARPIVWYEHVAVGERLGEMAGVPVYGQGTDAGTATCDVLVASRRAQGTGKNLQDRYSANLYLQVCSGKEMEQSIGRTHRPGQEADEVWVSWYAHTPELEILMTRAIEDARFQEQLHRQRQKLLYATYV